jgi:sirohydrochlorin ferrochelatase
MDALVLIFHGNRDAGAGREAAELAGALGARLAQVRVSHGFLQHARPTPAEAIAAAAAAGAKRIELFPLLVLTGGHVARDVPAVLDAARRAHPGVTFRTLPHFAAHPRFAELLADLVRGA